MALDVSWVAQGVPIYAFLLVFGIFYAIMAKVNIVGESKAINGFIALIFAVIFLSFSTVREYMVNVTVWFAVLLTGAFLFMLLIMFIIKDPAKFFKPLCIIFIILLALVMIMAIFYTFPGARAYLPGESESGANETLINIKHFILRDSTLSGILLVIVAAIAIFVVTR
ncbi:hypothetical protein A3K73_00010 [Candidatus Pacearchaeota archaeon RBG_13_36_9]|nr:MAG: hypothetical protein A3K73_00010 [Candidatus Pacearchaeota archaeon RBG_13_36_9]